MSFDPRRARPGELVQLLNSGPRGAVTNAPRLARHRQSAGFRIGDGKRVDLVRYVAWLREQRAAAIAKAVDDRTQYEKQLERSARRQKELSASGREIGELPEVADPERRGACDRNLRLFLETYFFETFSLSWSPDHLEMIEVIERAVLSGGRFADAMPRGSGKTSIFEGAALWAVLYGHRRFPFVVGADKPAAEQILDSLKTDLETNDLLLEDFPEVCYPIRRLDGIAQRAAGQTFNGERTRITWTGDELVLPTIAGSKASGAILRVAGITGRIRGAKFKTPDGRTVRPDLVLIDDPQTEESARSPSQCEHRERIIKQAILGLGGPGIKIAAFAAVTVVREDDLADRLLDQKRNPEWQGKRMRMLVQFPTRMDLWEDYDQIRRECLESEGTIRAATAFYAEHREDMDDGAVASWEARYFGDELSAVQHAMNLYFEDPEGFWSEYQNEPGQWQFGSDVELTAERVLECEGSLPRWEIPDWADYLTASIDVQLNVLFWMVTAWSSDATGSIVAYGATPDQKSSYWTLAEAAKRSYRQQYEGSWETSLGLALEATCDRLLGKELKRSDGTPMRVERATVDAGWGESTDTVYAYIRSCPYKGTLVPAHGRGVGASATPFVDLPKKKGERRGMGWRNLSPSSRHGVRYVLFDTNLWKSWVRSRFLTPSSEPGALMIHATGDRMRSHQMLADHCSAEKAITVTRGTRAVDEWKIRAAGRDNHWWDCLVGCSVAASMLGVRAGEVGDPGPRPGEPRRRVSFSEMQQQARERRAGAP